GTALKEQRELLARQDSPRAELLRALADWQWVEATGDADAARRLLESVKKVRAQKLPVEDELAVMEFQATWVLEGLWAALKRLEAEHARVGEDDGVEHLPWLYLARFLLGTWPELTDPPDALDSSMASAWWAMKGAVALKQKRVVDAKAALAKVQRPPFAGAVRSSPMWAASEGLRAVLLVATGSTDEGRAASEALVRELEAEPTWPRQVRWARALAGAVERCTSWTCVGSVVEPAGP
ncbi:MAG: hypothetical protein JNM17_37210, partial [Archangium sp.]|nr:hypothetical protein [Archangium sp.]